MDEAQALGQARDTGREGQRAGLQALPLLPSWARDKQLTCKIIYSLVLFWS